MAVLTADTPSLGYSNEKHEGILNPPKIGDAAPDDLEESDASVASEREAPVKPVVDIQKARNRAQRDAFDQYVKQKTIEQNVMEDAETPSQKRAVDESLRLIHRAREYQQELFERAKDENVIAV